MIYIYKWIINESIHIDRYKWYHPATCRHPPVPVVSTASSLHSTPWQGRAHKDWRSGYIASHKSETIPFANQTLQRQIS